MTLVSKARSFLSGDEMTSFSTGGKAFTYSTIGIVAACAATPVLLGGAMITAMLGILPGLSPLATLICGSITLAATTLCAATAYHACKKGCALAQNQPLQLKQHGRAYVIGQGAALTLLGAAYTFGPNINPGDNFNDAANIEKSGPEETLSYEMTSNNCEGETAQEFLRFMREQNTTARCIPPTIILK